MLGASSGGSPNLLPAFTLVEAGRFHLLRLRLGCWCRPCVGFAPSFPSLVPESQVFLIVARSGYLPRYPILFGFLGCGVRLLAQVRQVL